MNLSRQHLGLGQTVVALAVVAAFSPARAQEEPDIAKLTAPGSSVSIGIGLSSGDEKDRARFGMFNGLREHDVNGLFGFTYLNRDNESGRWMSFEGRNLGLDNRELGYSYRQLGEMKFTADWSELVRHDPRTINTSLQGAGTTTPTVSLLATPGTGQDLNLELKRKALGLVFEKRFGDLQVEVNFKNEDKDGARLWGRGFACSAGWGAVGACTAGTGSAAAAALTNGAAAVLMLPEPVNSTIRQLDAKLNYSGEKLRLSGGYYGSFYTNNNGTLTPTIVGGFGNQNLGANPANAGLAATLGLPMALWPDNQSHQLFLGGNYTIAPKTRVNFKYAYTHATQNESFTGMGLAGAPAGRGDLDGVINTTKAQVGFSAHPLDKLHLYGDWAYVSKKNNTPLAPYNLFFFGTAPAVTSATFTNGNQSSKKYDAKLEASYKLPANYLLTGGVKYEHEDFGTFTPTEVAGGISGLRQELKETGYRVELRKTMSETLTGAISYVSSRRKGDSSWLKPLGLPATGVIDASPDCVSATVGGVPNACIYGRTAIFPFIYMDRNRDKIRLNGNWTPMDRLSFQIFWDDGIDEYHGPTEHGLRKTKMGTVSLDAAYTLSDAWKLNAYMSRGQQALNSGHSTGYDADYKDTNTTFGAGVTGMPTSRLRLGADLIWENDKLAYVQTLDAFNTSATNTALIAGGGLPDVTYRLLRLKLYGEYAVQKNAYVRLDFIHNRTFFNEWTYNFNGAPFLYSDNTTINARQKQSVSFLGASYTYKFQ